MAKYKLKALSIHLKGRVFRKHEGVVFEDGKFDPIELAAAEKAGFLERLSKKEENDLDKVKAKADADAKAKADADAKAKADADAEKQK